VAVRAEKQKRTSWKRRVRKEEGMVVEKRKPNKESVSGLAGFGPQAQSVKVCGQC
jgi:hypothetical protein